MPKREIVSGADCGTCPKCEPRVDAWRASLHWHPAAGL